MIAGVVPSAGASTRMGWPKALLQVEGGTFVHTVVSALREGGCEPVIVVVPDDPEIERAARATGAQVVVNADPGEGPITSLRLALRQLPPEATGVVYHPVDHPMVAAATVRRVVECAREGNASLVVPTHRGERGHPAFFGRGLFEELLDESLEGGARTVVHRHLTAATLVEVDDAGILRDIDTPAGYAQALGVDLDR